MKKILITIGTVSLGVSFHAQEKVFVNKGEMSVEPGTIVSTYLRFDNQSEGEVLNNGLFHFYRDYNNDGLFSFRDEKVSEAAPLVAFEGGEEDNLNVNIQDISGTAQSRFYNVLFNKRGREKSFSMSNSVVVVKETEMREGIVFMDHGNGGAITYKKGANHTLTSDYSHIHGEVIKEGDEGFKYPVGKGGYYRFAAISAPKDKAHRYYGEYFLENSNAKYPHSSRENEIGFIDNREYWTIEQGTSTNGSLLVTLSWDERTTPYELYQDDAKRMKIVRWDEGQKKWIDEGGIVNLAEKSITTAMDVRGFGVFTLGMLGKGQSPEVIIFNGITDNNDSSNDHMVIKDADKYKNRLRIYNRWGVQVYETDDYAHNDNFFKGISEGRLTIDKNKKLPQGTYYYIFEYINEKGENVDKAGWIYLKND